MLQFLLHIKLSVLCTERVCVLHVNGLCVCVCVCVPYVCTLSLVLVCVS